MTTLFQFNPIEPIKFKLTLFQFTPIEPITFEVTQHDITYACKAMADGLSRAEECVVAKALRRAFPRAESVQVAKDGDSVYFAYFRFPQPDGRSVAIHAQLDENAARLIAKFDACLDVEPITAALVGVDSKDHESDAAFLRAMVTT